MIYSDNLKVRIHQDHSNIGSGNKSSKPGSFHGRNAQVVTPGKASTPSTSELSPGHSERLLNPETTDLASRSGCSLTASPEPLISAPVAENRQAGRQQDLRIGTILLVQGIAQIGIGLTDSIFHIDDHNGGHDYDYDHDYDDDHDDHDDDGHVQEHPMPVNISSMHNGSIFHNENHDPYHLTAARRMRQAGHICEGICSTIAGAVKLIGALRSSNSNYSKFKFVSNALQALGFFGTAAAATADWLHKHTSHGIAHTSQAVLTVAMTMPDIFLRTKKTSEEGLPDIALQEKRKAIGKKIAIASNFADAVPSCFLAVSMKSPFYAIETVCNLFMGLENALCYRSRKNERSFITAEFTTNSAQDEDKRVRVSVIMPEQLKSEINRFNNLILPALKNLDTDKTQELLNIKTIIEEILNKTENSLEQTVVEITPLATNNEVD